MVVEQATARIENTEQRTALRASVSVITTPCLLAEKWRIVVSPYAEYGGT